MKSLRNSLGRKISTMSSEKSNSCASAPYLKKPIRSVVGMTSALQKSSPKSALSRVDLPALTSPTTTKRKGSSRFARRFLSKASRAGLIPPSRPRSVRDWIAELRREDPGDPFDVETNIAYGATYLAWLTNYFDGDIELVIASYNGGQGYVRRLFTSDFVAEDKDEFYREIDRSETREYLQRVYENLAVYRALYPTFTVHEEPVLVSADPASGD